MATWRGGAPLATDPIGGPMQVGQKRPIMKSLRHVGKRLGRCYELTFRAMKEEIGSESFTLVHGYINLDIMLIAHAWIETGDGRIYDPNDDQYIRADEYATAMGAVAERRYTRAEAIDLVSREAHCGPWHRSREGVVDPGSLADLIRKDGEAR
jgi:hypothetical protein